MKFLILFSFFCPMLTETLGQKPVIDTSAIKKWPVPISIADVQISNNGLYVLSYIKDISGYGMELRAVSGKWSQFFPMANTGRFTSDNKWTIIKENGDSLCVINNETKIHKWIYNVNNYKVLSDINGDWIAYRSRLKENEGDLMFWNVNTNYCDSAENVTDFVYYPQVHSVILLGLEKKSGASSNISLVRLKKVGEKGDKMLWRGHQVLNYSIDVDHDLMTFVSDGVVGHESSKSIWCYKVGGDSAVRLFEERNSTLGNNLLLANDRMNFSNNGTKLYFHVIEKNGHWPNVNDPVKVDIWNYKEIPLHESMLKSLDARSFSVVINLSSGKTIKLEDSVLKLYDIRTGYRGDKFAISYQGNLDFWWNENARYSIFLTSLEDGSRRLLKRSLSYSPSFQGLHYRLSPGEKYIVYFDPTLNSFFSYSITQNALINISKGLNVSWKKYTNNEVADPAYGEPMGIAAWGEQDSSVYVYDSNDIWQLDIAGVKNPVSVTNEFGRTHGVRFQLAESESPTRILKPNEVLLLASVDINTKDSGFYNCKIGLSKDPVLLSTGPYKYSSPVKANKSDTWIVIRESAMDSPNVYVTKDFKVFSPITNIAPQRGYNWMTSELVSWLSFDGTKLQGVLYKPENFDSTRKYPVIFNYYEIKSNTLNEFKRPMLMTDNLNIPYFVSRGYVVFQPDIKYKLNIGSGRSAFNSIVSAAEYLSKFYWVDRHRIGLQGHSFGGGETNYVVTHTKRFAAAMEAAGPCDDISSYGSLNSDGSNSEFYFEVYQGRMRKSLWDNPKMYLENSAILNANHVRTPLLMMHNKEDQSVPWSQAVEFFSALRRLKKKVWMLQYDGGNHSVGGVQSLDYTIRVEQFFDYYLKGTKPPVWMTRGISPNLKGYDNGYSLDDSGIIP